MVTQHDYAALRREAKQRLKALKKQTAQAERTGVDVARERVTITTAELFLTYAEWDRNHTAEVEAAIASWWRAKADAARHARELPTLEMGDVVHVLAEAQQELTGVMQGAVARRPSAAIDMTALSEEGGYYRQAGRPVFPSTFVWQPDDETLNEAYGVIGGKYIHLPHIRAEGERPNIGYEPDDDEPMGYIFMGQKHAPKWLKEKYPEITDGEHHYTGFDTDHPVARQLWADMLADVVPQFRGRKVSQAGYLLTNEPHWYTSTGGWAKGPVSEKTKAKFRVWLAQRHADIAALNTLWGTAFASFADVAIEIPIDSGLRGEPIWYDWCRFNMDRITDWFAFLRSEVRRHDPVAAAHIKLIPGQFAGSDRCHGLDFESLVRLQDIIGCDAAVVTAPHWKNPETWPERYACNWRDQALPLDFFRSISPGKVVFDSEWHGLSKSNLRDPRMPGEYVRAALWLAHLHGTGMNQTWYWSRNADGSLAKKSGSAFFASNLTQPMVMDAYGRTMKELNAFAPEVVALATQPKQVRLFYSEASAIQDVGYMGHVYDTYKALYHSGRALGFVTGRVLAEATAAELRSWPVVVVSHADRVTAADRKALQRYAGQGGTLVIEGMTSLKNDEYGRPYGDDLTMAPEQTILMDVVDSVTVGGVVADILQRAGIAAPVSLSETNAVGLPGCVWRAALWQGGQLLLIINLGKGDASINMAINTPCRDMITGAAQAAAFSMKPFDVKLLHVAACREPRSPTAKEVNP